MQKFKTLADMTRLIEFAHFHQLDKAGLPYVDHPKRVLATVQAQGVLPYVQIAALGHDLTEDTAFTPQMLLDLGFSEAAVRLIVLLDRNESLKQYTIDFWEKPRDKEGADLYYYTKIKENRDATIIKLADIRDNLSPWRQVYLEEETQKRLQAKYTKALEILNPAPVNHGFINTSLTVPRDPFHLR